MSLFITHSKSKKKERKKEKYNTQKNK